eukprot:355791-Chlamydomonas_euryale.AAC.18
MATRCGRGRAQHVPPLSMQRPSTLEPRWAHVADVQLDLVDVVGLAVDLAPALKSGGVKVVLDLQPSSGAESKCDGARASKCGAMYGAKVQSPFRPSVME